MKLKQTTTVEKTVESKSPISEKLQKMLVNQLQHEMYNHNLYMSLSNFYGVKGYSVLEEYYRLRAEEEYLHHCWIKDYLVFLQAF
jgi:ferritin